MAKTSFLGPIPGISDGGTFRHFPPRVFRDNWSRQQSVVKSLNLIIFDIKGKVTFRH